MNEIRFERTALYEQVWSQPIRTLAKQYGLSDNGLRKVCLALGVPLPGIGHWAKIAAGHQIQRRPLPKHTGPDIFVSRPPEPRAFDGQREQERLTVREQALSQRNSNLTLAFDSSAPLHKILVPYERLLRDSAKDCEKAHQEFLTPPKPKRWSDPRVRHIPGWKYWLEQGLELAYGHRALPFRVTPTTWQRALTLVNTIVRHAEASGMKIDSPEKSARITVQMGDAMVYLRVAELFDQEIVKPRDMLSRGKIKKGTGRLRLFISHSLYGAHAVTDKDGELLEARAEEILSLLDRQFASARIAELERQERERHWEDQRQRAALEQQRKESERRRLEEEKKRRDALVEEAGQWSRAQMLRAYAEILEGRLDAAADVVAKNGAAFVNELREVAAMVDPTDARLRSFEDRSTSEDIGR